MLNQLFSNLKYYSIESLNVNISNVFVRFVKFVHTSAVEINQLHSTICQDKEYSRILNQYF